MWSITGSVRVPGSLPGTPISSADFGPCSDWKPRGIVYLTTGAFGGGRYSITSDNSVVVDPAIIVE